MINVLSCITDVLFGIQSVIPLFFHRRENLPYCVLAGMGSSL